MSEWVETPLGELVDIFDSKRVPLSSAQRSKRKGPYPYFGAQGIIDHIDDFIFDGRYILVPEDGENLRSRKLPIARFAEGKFWVNNHAHIIKAKRGVSVDRFIQSSLEATHIGMWITGAAQPKLSQTNLKKIPLLVPPLEVQLQVSTILDSLDGLIESNRRRVELLEEMARAIYREWFVKFRYPGYDDVPLVDSALGQIPAGWVSATIGDALELKYGKALKADARRGGEVAVVTSAGIAGTHDESLVDGPTIVVGRKGNVGSVHWVDGPSWPIDTAYYVVTDLPLRFVFEQLRRSEFTNTHAAVPGLSREGAYAKPFLIPLRGLLDKYQSTVDPLGNEASALTKQSDSLGALRDLLLPKLVTGQIDVSSLDLDAIVEEVAS